MRYAQLESVKRYYVYMLRCADVGWDPGSYTHRRRPVRLVHSSEFANVDDAIRWEKQLKGWGRAKKQALVDGDWERVKALASSNPSTSSG